MHQIILVYEKDVFLAVQSFPSGSASGPDDLRPQHLKDMLSISSHETHVVLFPALTAFVWLVVEGSHHQLSILTFLRVH